MHANPTKLVFAVVWMVALGLNLHANLFAADHTWVLKQSTLTYHVSHPLHQTDGVSHAARQGHLS
jgi:hypothetical protein